MKSPQIDLDRRSAPFGILVLAILVALCLSAMVIMGATAGRLGSAMDRRLAGEITILVWGQGLESADAAAARAAELLSSQAGVQHTTILEPDDIDVVIGKFAINRSSGDGVPRLISLSGPPASIPSALTLRRVLQSSKIKAAIDDRRGGYDPLEMRPLIAASFTIVLCVALCAAFFTASFLSGGRSVGATRTRIDLMMRLGAEPAFIGSMVGRRLGAMAGAAGVIGAACADLILFGTTVGHGFWRSLAAPAFVQPRLSDGAWSAVSPLVVLAIAALGGGLGARRAFVRREQGL